MENISRVSYRNNYEYYKDISANENIVLRHTSALECLGMFVGYINDSEVDVYSLEPITNDNINCCIVDNFDEIEIIKIDNIYCTSFNQTINDMLSDLNSDLEALLQALSNYYYSNNQSFNGLRINKENKEAFKNIREWTIDYYKGGF